MDIVIRGLDPSSIKKIDEFAKKQRISRNTFLVNMIQNFTALEEFKSFEERYETNLDKCLRVIENNTMVLSEVMEMVKEE